MPNELSGVRVVSFESRRESEMAALLSKRGARSISAPSMREVSLPDPNIGASFASALLSSEYDGLVMLSGGGTRKLLEAASKHASQAKLLRKLEGIWLVCRGPKPSRVLRQHGLTATLVAPEPNTTSDLLNEMDKRLDVSGKRLAVQEYGESNAELLAALKQRGATVDSILIYEWLLPEDLTPLKTAIRTLVNKEAEAALFTSARQVVHTFQIAEELGLGDKLKHALNALVVLSIGPVTSASLEKFGVTPKSEPEHPKMGHLVSHLARNWKTLSAN